MPDVCVPAKAVIAAPCVVWPVPPFAIATVPVTFAALPEMLPETCEPGRLSALNVVSVELLEAVMLAAVPVVFWFNVGISAATTARKVGAPAEPLGAARK